ncbi:hypothetical protein [Bacillus sp. RS11]|uniref:hypothetical protein n=1 Tax=Lysinibacillus sp. RS11 TaxID=3242682 RepID=UPI0035C6628A
MFYLCESKASATNVFCSESEAAATKRQPERKSTSRFGRMSFILVRNGYDGILQKMRDTLKM